MSELNDGPSREPISPIERAQLATSANRTLNMIATAFSNNGEPANHPVTVTPDDILDRKHLQLGEDNPDLDLVTIGKESADEKERFTFTLALPRTPLT